MKILVVSPFFPHKGVPHAGGHYIYELIRGLHKRHEVHLLARIEPSEWKYVREMEALCAHLSLYPFETPQKRSPFATLRIIFSYIRLALKANLYIDGKSFDVVQVEYVETGLAVKRAKGGAFLLDAHDIISKPAERRYKQAKNFWGSSLSFFLWQLIKRAETLITLKFDSIITRSEVDKEYLLKMRPGAVVKVIPHPVKRALKRKRQKKINILFAGAMQREVNQSAVRFIFEKILPRVRESIPDTQFFVVGNNPPRFIQKYGREDKGVFVTGFVENIMEYYLDAAVFVTPLFTGGGIIAKNLDAMGAGVPVVTSSIGNEGIGALHGKSVLIADTAAGFSSQIIRVLQDRKFADEISEAARAFVTDRFSPEVIRGLVEESLCDLAAGSKR